MSRISSRTAPVNAKCSPTTGSSNFGHSTPGVSSSSRPLPIVNHWLRRVTPGLSCTAALPALPPLQRRLMSDDLPTFGTPTTMMRMGLPTMPLRSHAAICSRRMFLISGSRRFRPLPVLQSIGMATVLCCLKYSTHSAVRAGSAISDLFSSTILGLLPMILFSTGLRLLTGMRASISSATISTSFRLLWMARRVFAM